MIRQITVVTNQGAHSYWLGMEIDRVPIHEIRKSELLFTGDPYDHYIGYSKTGQMLFSINCLCPCDVQYIPNPSPEV
jgi:hypothetical protein